MTKTVAEAKVVATTCHGMAKVADDVSEVVTEEAAAPKYEVGAANKIVAAVAEGCGRGRGRCQGRCRGRC